jgi:hypothetical protein
MTSFPELVQPYLDIAKSATNILYCFVPLCIGASAALSMKNFLYAAIFAGLFLTVFSKFSSIVPSFSSQINSLFMFLIIGYSVSIGIKLAFNNWRGY